MLVIIIIARNVLHIDFFFCSILYFIQILSTWYTLLSFFHLVCNDYLVS